MAVETSPPRNATAPHRFEAIGKSGGRIWARTEESLIGGARFVLSTRPRQAVFTAHSADWGMMWWQAVSQSPPVNPTCPLLTKGQIREDLAGSPLREEGKETPTRLFERQSGYRRQGVVRFSRASILPGRRVKSRRVVGVAL